MIHRIGYFNIVPDLSITLDKNRYFEENKKDIYLELNLLEQYVILRGIFTHFNMMDKKEFNRVLSVYEKEQPEYMMQCIEQMIKDIEERNEQ